MAAALATAIAAAGGVAALQNSADGKPALPLARGAGSSPDDVSASPHAAAADPDAPDRRPETPMAERVAVLGLLNKRNGEARDLTLKPGQAVRVGDVVVRLRACETTGSWEPEQLTGAFVQLDTRARDGRWRRNFSGWLYKETPSLNVVEHPVYDVWPKSCAMTHPDVGPDTMLAGAVARGGTAPATRSAAKKSPAASSATPAAEAGAADVPDSASSNSER
jgi:hypothetical protein